MKELRLFHAAWAGIGTISALVTLGATMLFIANVIDSLTQKGSAAGYIANEMYTLGIILLVGGLLSIFHVALGVLLYWQIARRLGARISIPIGLGLLSSATIYGTAFRGSTISSLHDLFMWVATPGLVAGIVFHSLVVAIWHRAS